MENTMMKNQMFTQVRTEIKTITPAVAKAWLATSKGNRRENDRRVIEYAASMKSGEFTISNDMICFDEDGALINGHHRLKACIRSGAPFTSIVAYGMPSNAMFDQGLKRSLGDVLYMNGSIPKELSPTYVMSTARLYIRILNNGINGGYASIPSYIIRDFLNENADNILKVCTRISRYGKSNQQLCRKAPIQVALLAALKCGVSEETLFDFAKVINTGFSENAKQSAAVLMRNYILTNKITKGDIEICKACAFAQLAIQDFTNGTPRRRNYQKLYFPYIPDAKLKLD